MLCKALQPKQQQQRQQQQQKTTWHHHARPRIERRSTVVARAQPDRRYGGSNGHSGDDRFVHHYDDEELKEYSEDGEGGLFLEEDEYLREKRELYKLIDLLPSRLADSLLSNPKVQIIRAAPTRSISMSE